MAPPNPANTKGPLQPDQIEASAGSGQMPDLVDIKPLLARLWPKHPDVTADEISDAIAHFFTDRVDDVQAGALLMCLHFTELDRDPVVISQTAAKMRQAAAQVDAEQLKKIVESRGRKEGSYQGGFVSYDFSSLYATPESRGGLPPC